MKNCTVSTQEPNLNLRITMSLVLNQRTSSWHNLTKNDKDIKRNENPYEKSRTCTFFPTSRYSSSLLKRSNVTNDLKLLSDIYECTSDKRRTFIFIFAESNELF